MDGPRTRRRRGRCVLLSLPPPPRATPRAARSPGASFQTARLTPRPMRRHHVHHANRAVCNEAGVRCRASRLRRCSRTTTGSGRSRAIRATASTASTGAASARSGCSRASMCTGWTIRDLIFRDGNGHGQWRCARHHAASPPSDLPLAVLQQHGDGQGRRRPPRQVKAPCSGSTLGGVGVSGNTFGSGRSRRATRAPEGLCPWSLQAREQRTQASTAAPSPTTPRPATAAPSHFEVTPAAENISLDGNIVVGNRAGGSGGGGYVAIDVGFLNVTN